MVGEGVARNEAKLDGPARAAGGPSIGCGRRTATAGTAWGVCARGCEGDS